MKNGDAKAQIDVSAEREYANAVAETLRVCAHPNRLMILCLLEHRPWSVSALAMETGLTQPMASQHLARLRNAGIITSQRTGNVMNYSLNGHGSLLEFRALLKIFCVQKKSRASVASNRS